MKKISKYQLFSELQRGPITRVYKAIQPELQRVVLVKQLNTERIMDEDLVERFKQEGLILAKINSPNVITIFDFGYDDNVPFLVTEFVEGNTLAELIVQNGALPYDLGLFILQQLTQGLCALHHQNIIHQDIKPENIYISNEGEVKLGDLGFSVILDQVDQQIQGTPSYLAPEVVSGSPVDFRCDLYSLGLVGYEMLTGDNPYAADDIQTIFNRIVNLKPITVHVVRPEVPEKFSTLIARLMAQNPDERLQSATELSRQLDDLKISMGIKVDGNSLTSFMQNPDQYQISRLIPDTNFAKPDTKQKKRSRAVFIVGLFAIIILGILLIKILDNGPSFLPNRTDTTTIAINKNFNQIKDQNDIPTISNIDIKKVDPSGSKEILHKSLIQKELKADSLKVPFAIPTRLDTITITSDPKAFVFLKNDSLGITPLSLISDAEKNELEIELQTPGFPIIKKTVTRTDQTAQKIHINFWKEVGYLDIAIIPWGEIWIDGDSIDVSPINRPIVLAPGNHRLMVRHSSLKNITESFYVAIGETLKKTIQLQRIP